MRILVRLGLVVLLSVGCGSDAVSGSGDLDGDGISNADEGLAQKTNTDGDEFPDYRDLDSDGDGIPDRDEAGDTDLTTPPVDTDHDGIPDYRDLDSDGDGVSDTDELGEQFEIVDTDQDGTPDFRDLDSDGDGILDKDEGLQLVDLDGDGVPDFRDLDADGDGIPDACESGDADPATQPIDSDQDGIPDFRDVDSDGDGIADKDEDKNGNCMVDAGESNPRNSDTDGDGVPDLVEKLAGSDPNDVGSTIPATDFYFVLPYLGDSGTGNLDFSTTLRQADVFFSIDNTGSFDGETDNIKATIQATVIPQISATIANVAFGVGTFRDFPLDPYGLAGDRPFELRQVVTTSVPDVVTAIAALPAPVGGLDTTEAGYEALFQWATGAGIPALAMAAFQSNLPTGIGGAGFRPDALPIVVQITDATAHAPDDYGTLAPYTHGRDEVVAAMNGIGARVIGINSLENVGTAFASRPQLEDLAVATKATIPPDVDGLCPTGVGGATYPPVMVAGAPRCPVVFDVNTDGTGLGTLIVDAIHQLAALGVLDISTRPIGKTAGEKGETLPSGTTTADFITAITPVAPPPAGATIDGDVFRGVTPGSKVTFKLDAYNDFVPSTNEDQLFTVNIQVLGDGVTVLDTRKVFIIVPRTLEQPIP